MKQDTTLQEFQALAEFRYLTRGYLSQTERACRAVDLEPLHYAVLLQLAGVPAGRKPTIGFVAQRLHLRHNTTVELVDRMEKRNLLRRVRSTDDRRVVELHVTPSAKAALKQLVNHRIQELTVLAPAFLYALDILLERRTSARGS
jgi:DNA-binding MarR family transcriptional regulator